MPVGLIDQIPYTVERPPALGGRVALRILDQNVLAREVVGRQHGLRRRQQVRKRHPLLVRIPERRRDVAAQRHRIREFLRHHGQRHDVAILHDRRETAVVQPRVLHGARRGAFGRIHPLDHHPVDARQRRDAACVVQQLTQRLVRFAQLVDTGCVERARQRDARTRGRNDDDVARQQMHVVLHRAVGQEAVDVERRDLTAAPIQRHRPHRPVERRASARKQRVDDRRRTRHGVASRRHRLAHDINLDRPQTTERRIHVEIREIPAEPSAQQRIELGSARARHRHHADARNAHLAVAIHDQPLIARDAPPRMQQHLVAGTDHVVVRDRNVIQRAKGRRRRKKVVTEQRQHPADILLYEDLKIGQRRGGRGARASAGLRQLGRAVRPARDGCRAAPCRRRAIARIAATSERAACARRLVHRAGVLQGGILDQSRPRQRRRWRQWRLKRVSWLRSGAVDRQRIVDRRKRDGRAQIRTDGYGRNQ
ncbi:hypothetical protein DM82_4495 [Burkholderia oklahomensis]|uniref:Uncharacterized protein n=1 Tax=Burkholderia oklahomensis TaxID=342113 RepID=A0AAI8BB05_9BURK|nr:hypothetical protein DM82_4495 [Burkholderia oklahomensis]